jgi:hypothetical protein
VAPYLAKKRAKTFMTIILLGCDLRKYLASSDYANDLNAPREGLFWPRASKAKRKSPSAT